MSLLEQIRADQLQARKNRESIVSELLTTLIGEAAMVGKNAGNRESTDEEVIAVIKKFVKNIDETLKVASSSNLQFEKQYLMKYLPQQLTKEQIRQILVYQFPGDCEDIKALRGPMMKHLKENYAGRYDGKLASEVVAELLV